jgi:hypothetical protein
LCSSGYQPNQLTYEVRTWGSSNFSGDNQIYGYVKFDWVSAGYSSSWQLPNGDITPYLTADSYKGNSSVLTTDSSGNVLTFSRGSWTSIVKTDNYNYTVTYDRYSYECVVAQISSCEDGGQPLNNSCDRTCEEIGLISDVVSYPVIGGNNNYIIEKRTICISPVYTPPVDGVETNIPNLEQGTSVVDDDNSFADALSNCSNQCGAGNVANMSNSGDCTCISFDSDSSVNNNTPVQNINTNVTENTTNITNNTTNNSQTSQPVQQKLLNYSYNDSELSDADLQKIIDDIQIGNEIANNVDNNVQDLNNNVVAGLNQVNENLGVINGTLNDSLNFEKQKLQQDFQESQKEVDEAEARISEANQKLEQQEDNILDFMNSLLSDYNTYKSQLDQIESSLSNGFEANMSGGGAVGECMQISAFGATYNLNPCSYIGEMSPVISVFVQLVFILLSIKIVFFGLSNFRLMR